MPWINTESLTPEVTARFSQSLNNQVYNSLDCCLTYEIWEEIRKANEPTVIYDFERALQAPYLEIMQRGFLVDDLSRRQAVTELRERIGRLTLTLNELAQACWSKGVNPRSPAQLKDLFYTSMKFPEIWMSQKGQRKLAMNRETLEKLDESYMYARPLVQCILRIRELSKQVEVLETEIDPDGRMRTSYNIAGTETGRPSSSQNAFGTGTNLQNITPSLRYAFTADRGYKMCVIDLEQVEARDVGFFIGCLFDDWLFLDACECLTAEHEVLTPIGWQSIATMPEQLLIWNNGKTSFETPTKWNEGVAEDFIVANSRSISVQGTLNHTMPVLNDAGIVHKTSLLHIKYHPNFKAPNTGVFCGGNIAIDHPELRAAFQADGSRTDNGGISFTFVKTRKINLLRQYLNESGLHYSEIVVGNGNTRFYVFKGQEHWNKKCGAEILNWDFDSLSRFCHSHKFWDGHFDTSNVRICGKDTEHMKWLATAYSLLGYATNLIPHKVHYWTLTIKNNSNMQYRSAKISKIKTDPQSVYCPTVSSGYFMVRRHGKIFISGNSGDLHSMNARLIWPELSWTGDRKADRAIADQIFYRDFSYRDMAKRGSHLSNYSGTAWTAARSLKVPLPIMQDFQDRYCRGENAAYPGIPRWWQWTAQQLQTTALIETPFGRRRHFFGRPGDDTTLREAIAFLPQSTTADRMNLGMWRVWKEMPEVQLLGQTYDSITFQYREELDEREIIEKALKLIEVELVSPSGRKYCVPGEAKVGFNWGSCVIQTDVDKALRAGKKPPRLNPGGLVKWSRTKPDLRRNATGFQRFVGESFGK